MKFCRVAIEPYACFVWAFLLLCLPLRWMIAFFLAASIHELSHFLMLVVMRKHVEQLRIGIGGIQMEVTALSYGQELFCALAGPMSGFLLLGVCNWYPELSICAFAQSLYNLLPVYPLDGGRALRCWANILLPDYADKICAVIEFFALILIAMLSIVFRMGFAAFIMGCILIIKVVSGKIPCKQPRLRVQ